jgi:hypothetical protein
MNRSSLSDYPDREPDLFFELARERLNTQLSTIDALDGKIGLLFSLASGLLGILAAVLALRSATGEDSISRAALAVVIAAGIAYCVVAYAGITAYLARVWKIGPDLSQVWEVLWTADADALVKWKVATAIWADYEANRDSVQAKTNALTTLFAGIIIQSLLLAVALVLVAAGV